MPDQTITVGLRATPRPGAGTRRPGAYQDTTAGQKTARRRVVVIGAPEDVPRALAHPALTDDRFLVRAALSVDVDVDDGVEIAERLAGLLRTKSAESILVAGPLGPGTMRRIGDLALLHHVDLLAVMPTETLVEHVPVIVWNGDSPLVQLAQTQPRAWALATKRAVDVLGATVGLIITAPVLATLFVAICLESPGMPLFRHERVGHRGKRFQCLKLRTMRVGAEEELRGNPTMYEEYRRHHFKIPDAKDPRTTALGRFLRRTSLDELPQLWNVLLGDMSLVGPRPVVEEELALYEGSRDLLLSMRPGITGAWAVNGRHYVGYPRRCEIELQYVRQWNVLTDLKILAATTRAVVDLEKAD